MILHARYGGQCRACDREIWIDDRIEWEPGEGASHFPNCDGFEDRRIGSAAEVETLDLPKFRDDTDEPGLPPGGWENYRPKERGDDERD